MQWRVVVVTIISRSSANVWPGKHTYFMHVSLASNGIFRRGAGRVGRVLWPGGRVMIAWWHGASFKTGEKLIRSAIL